LYFDGVSPKQIFGPWYANIINTQSIFIACYSISDSSASVTLLIKYYIIFGTIENIMEVVKIQGKGTHLNTIEKFYIHKKTLSNNEQYEDHSDTSNLIFNTLTPLQT
jgi:hypothetical protein